jgi:hypothetical protein
MNHIPIPEHFLPDHRIDVPFLVDDQTAYDNKGFLNFPSRIAIPLQSIVLGDLRGTSSSDWITFVQSWAYFGLLVEFFRTADIEVDVNEFLEAPSEDNGELLVTSRELPKYLRLWELKSRKTTRSEWRVRKRACVTYLQAASELVRDIGGLDQTGPERLFSAVRDLDADPLKIWQAVHLSAIILGEQLHDALETYYGTDLYPHFGRSLLLAQRMLIAGWCPSEIRMHEDQKLDQTTFYYFQLMDRRALGRDHGKCTSSHCWTEKIDWSTYRTAHVLGCACPQDWEDDSKARVWVEQVCHIVRRGSIALITAQANGAPGTCLQNPSETLGKGEHKIYVAISHVWSESV